ncbi:hypothetical protein FRB96_006142 [Tulasnella sp. 330]|nr:hypothetical protein FRB96_006142 [Tulasnella sp. 330]
MKSTALAFLSILSTSLVSAGPTPLNQEKRTSLSSIFGEIIAELSGSGSSTTSSQCPSNEFAWTFLGDPLPSQWDSDIVPSDRWSLVVHGYGSFWDIMSLQLLLAFNVPVLRSCYRDHIILTVVQQQLVLNHAVFPMVGHQRPPRPEHRAPAIGTGIPPWLAAPPKRLKQAPAPPLAPTTSSGGLPHQAVYQAEEQPQAHVPPARHVPPPGTGTRATAAAFPKTREAILYPHARVRTAGTPVASAARARPAARPRAIARLRPRARPRAIARPRLPAATPRPRRLAPAIKLYTRELPMPSSGRTRCVATVQRICRNAPYLVR